MQEQKNKPTILCCMFESCWESRSWKFSSQEKKLSLCVVMDVPKFTVVIILQYMHISNHYIVHLKLTLSVNYTSIKNLKTHAHGYQETHPGTSTAVLFERIKNYKQWKYLPTEEYINDLWCIHLIKYCISVKIN